MFTLASASYDTYSIYPLIHQLSFLGAGFTKPCALLKLDFLTSAYNKCMALVRKSSFSKAQKLRETGPWVPETIGDMVGCNSVKFG